MSLGTDSDNQSLQDAVDAAYENGSLLVAAAGNAGTTGEVVSGCAVEYPGAYQSVMAISAINKNNELAYFSCTGPEVELTAPGVDVNSTELDDSYGKKSGTSMSTPHVSGLAALIYHSIIASGYDNDSDGQWDNTEVRQRLRDTAIDLGSDGKDDSFGYGLINATAAVGVQARPTAGTGALDGDDDGTRLTHLHGDGDPGDGTRDGVVHLTSHNDSTLDYALTVADISTQDHTLDGITQLEFEYFEGENNTDAAPDEVWLVIENDTGRHIVYRTFNDGSITAPTEWRTQDVVPAIEDSDRPWVEVSTPEPNPDPRHALDSLSEDNLTEVGGNLTEVYGGGASVLAVGVGHGAPLSGPTTVDLYVDNLTVNSRGHDFPIAHVTVEPDPLNKSEGGVVNATIDLEGEWGGRTVHDINPNTVALAGVIAESDSARYPDPDDDGQDELRLEFNRTAVNDALSTGEDVPVTVDGVFVQGTVAFAATDHITVKD